MTRFCLVVSIAHLGKSSTVVCPLQGAQETDHGHIYYLVDAGVKASQESARPFQLRKEVKYSVYKTVESRNHHLGSRCLASGPGTPASCFTPA